MFILFLPQFLFLEKNVTELSRTEEHMFQTTVFGQTDVAPSPLPPHGRRTPASPPPHVHARCISHAISLAQTHSGRCRPASRPHEPQARPLAIASAHRPVLSPLAPPLPDSAPHLNALPVLAARVLAWRLALRRIADPSPHTVATALLVQPVASLSIEPSCCSKHAQRPPPLLFKHAPAPFCLPYSILH